MKLFAAVLIVFAIVEIIVLRSVHGPGVFRPAGAGRHIARMTVSFLAALLVTGAAWIVLDDKDAAANVAAASWAIAVSVGLYSIVSYKKAIDGEQETL